MCDLFLHDWDFSRMTSGLVHIGIMFSLRISKIGASYAASKHAALGMVKSAAEEAGLRTSGLHLAASLCPISITLLLSTPQFRGAIDTPMHQVNLARTGDFEPTPTATIHRDRRAEGVASVAVFLFSEESSYVTGASCSMDWGANA